MIYRTLAATRDYPEYRVGFDKIHAGKYNVFLNLDGVELKYAGQIERLSKGRWVVPYADTSPWIRYRSQVSATRALCARYLRRLGR